MRQKSAYDFNDMIQFVLTKFQTDEDLRYYYAEKYQFIMLDELQDTNNAQNEIIDLILSVNQDKPNIMVVWDDDQSIYRFQWANIENMLDFSIKYPDLTTVVLENNYRSNQAKYFQPNASPLDSRLRDPWNHVIGIFFFHHVPDIGG